MRLSYYDIDAPVEKTYHVFFLGLYIGAGYECKSNLEAGLGRFDLLLKTRGFNAIIEFKAAESSTDDALSKEAERALEQIEGKEYWHAVKGEKVPLYKIGIACHGKKCMIKTFLHEK